MAEGCGGAPEEPFYFAERLLSLDSTQLHKISKLHAESDSSDEEYAGANDAHCRGLHGATERENHLAS